MGGIPDERRWFEIVSRFFKPCHYRHYANCFGAELEIYDGAVSEYPISERREKTPWQKKIFETQNHDEVSA